MTANVLMATPKNFDVLDVVLDIARQRGATPSTVSLAWVLSKPLITNVIIGARSVQQLDDNLAALELKLSPEEIARLDEVSRPAWGYPYDFIGSRQPW